MPGPSTELDCEGIVIKVFSVVRPEIPFCCDSLTAAWISTCSEKNQGCGVQPEGGNYKTRCDCHRLHFCSISNKQEVVFLVSRRASTNSASRFSVVYQIIYSSMNTCIICFKFTLRWSTLCGNDYLWKPGDRMTDCTSYFVTEPKNPGRQKTLQSTWGP